MHPLFMAWVEKPGRSTTNLVFSRSEMDENELAGRVTVK